MKKKSAFRIKNSRDIYIIRNSLFLNVIKIVQVRRFLGKKKTDIVTKKINNEVDYQDGVVRVDAPQFRIFGIPLFLSDTTTVGDVILKYVFF